MRKVLSYISVLLIAGCASQTTPTGGPKDETPPKLLQSYPPDQSLNFAENKIELVFDEYVKVQKHKEQIIITPSIEGEYEIIAKKNKVFMTFKEEFEENTTYTINFREAIQDITENNPAENLKLTFSTGSYIDSLEVSGKVFDVLGLPLGDNVNIGLMRLIDTLNIFDYRPMYFGKTDKQGEFTLQNIKPGNYRLYAFNDINKNLKVDSKNEAYGFLSDTLKLFRNYDSVALGLFKLDARILKVNSARQTGTFFATKLSKGITEYTIDFDGLDSLYVHHLAESNSAIRIYPYDKVTDSVKFRLYAKDSIGFKIDTVLYYKVDFESRRIPENWELKTEASNIFVERRILQKKFTSSKPIIKLNLDSIYLFIDSTRTLTFNKEYLKLDTADNSVLFRVELDKADVDSLLRGPKADPRAARGESLKQVNPFLYFGKGALISIEKDSSKVYKENPKQISYTNTGTIITEVQSTSKSYIIQVIDNRNRLIAEERNNPKAIFRYLNPGDYRIRVLIDQNENGKWDMGNYFKNEIPEPVYIYKNSEGSETIKLLANWEIGPLVLTF